MSVGGGSQRWSAPLARWRVRNFKSIREADLELRPLTLLVGANSSGKTSFIQSLLLLVQAAQGGIEEPLLPLNGPLASVGGFEDARCKGTKDPIVLGGVFRSEGVGPRRLRSRRAPPAGAPVRPGPGATVDWWAEFDAPSPEVGPGTAEMAAVAFDVHDQADETEGRIRLKASRRGSGEVEEDRMRLRLGLLAVPVREPYRAGFSGRFEADGEELPITGLWIRGGIPHGFVTPQRLEQAAIATWLEVRALRPSWVAAPGLAAGLGMPRGWPPRPRGKVPSELDELATRAADEISRWTELRDEGLSLPQYLSMARQRLSLDERLLIREYWGELSDAIARRLGGERADPLAQEVYLPPDRLVAQRLYGSADEFHRFLAERVVYLGPLRQDPQVVYKVATAGITGFIGTKGEYTAAVLHAQRGRQVEGFDERGEPEYVTLAEAVSSWAKRLDIADEVQTADLARLGIQISVRRGGIGPVDITSVGVGVSQLLPVIVMCLMADPGTLILLEQPELHLHPALQQRLADFLLACAKSGRQLIVETHSEYLVSRLRRRFAEDPTDELIGNVAVYFVEQVDGESRFRQVPFNEYGAIEEWPVGFFDQAATDSRALLEAGLAKRAGREERA